MTLEQAQDGLRRGMFTSVDLVKAYTHRIREVTSLNAVNEMNPDALVIASQMDLERRLGTVRSPLHGVPILIKDNIATDDRMNNSGV